MTPPTTDAAVTPPRSPAAPSTGRRWRRGAVSGLLALAVTLGVAELVAAFVGATSAPVIAVGQGVIRLTPEPVKEFAIRTFGDQDKVALLVGTGLILLVLAVALGVVGTRRRGPAVAGVVLLGAVALVAAMTAPARPALAWLPSVVGTVVGVAALLLLLRRATAPGPVPAPVVGDADGTAAGDPAAPRYARMTDRKGSGLGRRGFLVASGGAAAVAAFSGGLGRALLARMDVAAARADLALPAPAVPAPALPAGVEVGVPGVTPFRTPNSEFYRVDTALVVPQVDPDTYRLRVTGMVRRELDLSLDDLLGRPLVEREITLTCVSNEVGGKLAGHARWLGYPLADLLEEAGVQDGADVLFTTSVDGWTSSTPVRTVLGTEGAMLAVGMNGEPLPVEHGFPVRMVVPGLYGYVSATKWLTSIEVTRADRVTPYWVERGWEAEAPIKIASRIDAPRGLARVRAGQRVAVAGVAWAQTRGISRVEVRVDGGEWQEARLAAVPNDDTWRQWVWEWEPEGSGLATLEVRATDGDGTVQDSRERPIFPDGSTGLHDVVVTVA